MKWGWGKCQLGSFRPSLCTATAQQLGTRKPHSMLRHDEIMRISSGILGTRITFRMKQAHGTCGQKRATAKYPMPIRSPKNIWHIAEKSPIANPAFTPQAHQAQQLFQQSAHFFTQKRWCGGNKNVSLCIQNLIKPIIIGKETCRRHAYKPLYD